MTHSLFKARLYCIQPLSSIVAFWLCYHHIQSAGIWKFQASELASILKRILNSCL